MLHRREAFQHTASHALGGRIGRQLFGMLCFEGLQFAEQLVVFRVGDGRRIQHIVAMVVALDLLAQLVDALCNRCHENSLRACALPGMMPCSLIFAATPAICSRMRASPVSLSTTR